MTIRFFRQNSDTLVNFTVRVLIFITRLLKNTLVTLQLVFVSRRIVLVSLQVAIVSLKLILVSRTARKKRQLQHAQIKKLISKGHCVPFESVFSAYYD